jgi:hypothetical protein
MLDALKNLLGKKFIATVVTAIVGGILPIWNAAHGNPITPDMILQIEGILTVVICVFLGIQNDADKAKANIAALGSSVPMDAHVAAITALAGSTPADGTTTKVGG